jgi:hypothetical protein
MQKELLLFNISTVLVIINFILYLRGFNLFSKAYNVYTIYLGISSLILIWAAYTFANKIPNGFLTQGYLHVRFIFISIFYYLLFKNLNFKKAIKTIMIIYALIFIIKYSININSFFSYSLLEAFLCNFFIAIFSSVYFYQMLNERKNFYYINTASIIFSFGGSIFFLSANLSSVYYNSISTLALNINSFFVIIISIFVFIEWKTNFQKLPKKG